MTIYLIVGLPGAGKTTRAKELEVSESALRLTPDDWQMAVFHLDGPTRWRSHERAGQRDQIEGKLVEVGMRAAGLGIDVVLDFGLWSKDERSALRWLAASLGVRAQVVYLPVDLEEQRRRIDDRYRSRSGHFQLSDAELEQWQVQFQAPDHEELHGTAIPAPPPGTTTWSQWASQRWPSLPEQLRTPPVDVFSVSDGRSRGRPVAGSTSSGHDGAMTLADARLVSFIGVADLDAAERFYGGVLGLSLEDARPYALVADTGTTQLRITAVGAVHAAPHTVLGWQVADLEATVDALVAKGVQFQRYEGMEQDDRGIWTAPGNARIAWFHDPDGNTLSLQA